MIEIGGKLFNPDHISAAFQSRSDVRWAVIVLVDGTQIWVLESYDEVKAALA